MEQEIGHLRREIGELRVEVERLSGRQRSSTESGSPRNPISVMYLLDPETKAVAKVTYSRNTGALKVQEV